ncbi:MAG: hypothetical protein ACQER1_18290 [Armatimonadota bacterium]
MKKRQCIAIILTLMVTIGLAVAQQEAAPPWEEWQPPEVQMPEPNAWDIYLLAAELEEQIHGRLREEAGLPAPDPEGDAPPQFPPGVDPNVRTQLDMTEQSLEPETLERLINAYTPVFSALEAAIAGDAQAPLLRTGEDIEQAFPDFAEMRQFARMLASRSVYHMQNDHALSAALDGIAAMRVGVDCATGQSMISGLVQEACVAIGEARLREAIPYLTDNEARIAMNALQDAMGERADFAEIMEGEATFSKTYFGNMIAPAMAGGADLEALTEQGHEIPEGAVTAEGTWEALGEFLDAMQTEAAKPWWAREPIEEPDNPLAATLLPAHERAGSRFAYSDARLCVALTALAAQAYRSDTGSYPASLEQLVPHYLDEVPRDPFVDAPLRSVAHDPVSRAHPGAQREPTGAGVLTIYSVGYDQDDDGGADVGNRIEEDGDIALTLGGG